jgi:hypothetical protein
MRRIGFRPALPPATQKFLDAKTREVAAADDPKTSAETLYKNARATAHFEPVLSVLRAMSGAGQRCMYCSGNEGAQVEHWQPKSRFWHAAFAWPNLLWVCGQCNQLKGERFDEACPPIHPVAQNIWAHCYIDAFGQLCPIWRDDLDDLDPHAQATIALLALDRQTLQEARFARLRSLRELAQQKLQALEAGELTPDALEIELLEWFTHPFQTDVADYFLDGPGATDPQEPFRALLQQLSSTRP